MSERPRGLQVAAYRYNCQPCKQRKTKCDRVKPCASCQLRGTQDRCYADEEDLAASDAHHSTSATLDTNERRPAKRARVSHAAEIAQPSAASTSIQADDEEIREQVAALRRMADQLEARFLPSTVSHATSTHRRRTPSPSYSPTFEHQVDPILTSNTYLTWTDVQHLFPSQRDTERILNYFLQEMVYIMLPVQESQYWRAWKRLIRPHTSTASSTASLAGPDSGISRCMVGSLLMCLASTSLLIPDRRERELDLARPMEEQRDAWITAAIAVARTGQVLSTAKTNEWVHYLQPITDTSLDRFGFDTTCVRIFSLLGMADIGYHINGECLRRAVRVALFDESRASATDVLPHDDPELSLHELVQIRRRIGISSIIIERYSCMYAGLRPIVDEDAELLPAPEKGSWSETERVTYEFSRYVNSLRLLPAQLGALTARKKGDWATQRAREQEAVSRVLEIDRGLCAAYDPEAPRETLGGSTHEEVLAELPALLERGDHLKMSDKEINHRHRDFASALMMKSSWLCLRALATSNLMFLPWVPEASMRYYALHLARQLVELLPGIWILASGPYIPFSSSWISRHLFLACTILSVPILGQETSSAHITPVSRDGGEPGNPITNPDRAGSDFAPSRLHKSHLVKLPPTTSKLLDLPRIPSSSSVDLDWFGGKLVEIASLFNKLAERGDQTSEMNRKLVYALLNSRAELRGRWLDKLGQKAREREELEVGMSAGEGVGRIESQKDLTNWVMASNVGRPGNQSSPASSGKSPAGGATGSPKDAMGYKSHWTAPRGGSKRKDTPGGAPSPSLHDLADAVDTHTTTTAATTAAAACSARSTQTAVPHYPQGSQPPAQQIAPAEDETGWIYQNTQTSTPSSFFPAEIGTPSSGGTAGGTTTGGGGTDVLSNMPFLLDTQDWLAILDGVDIPL